MKGSLYPLRQGPVKPVAADTDYPAMQQTIVPKHVESRSMHFFGKRSCISGRLPGYAVYSETELWSDDPPSISLNSLKETDLRSRRIDISSVALWNIDRWNFFVDIKSALGNNPALFSG